MEYGETQMSVEWLETKIQKEIATYGSISPKMISIFAEQAKVMHKKEIKDAYDAGVWDVGCRAVNFDEYWNINFKSE